MKEKMTLSKRGFDASTLKIIAIVGMTLDHIGIVFGGHMSLGYKTALYALGGLTFPIMAYFIGEGYTHTSNFKKYATRIFLFALIAQIPYSLAFGLVGNVLFTLFLGLIMIHLSESLESRSLFLCILIVVTIGSIFLDWGGIGVVMVYLYYQNRNEKWQTRLVIPYLIVAIRSSVSLYNIIAVGNLRGLPAVAFVLVGCTLAIPLLKNYNGEKGRPMKYFFYWYYPLHLLVLWAIRGVFFGQWFVW